MEWPNQDTGMYRVGHQAKVNNLALVDILLLYETM